MKAVSFILAIIALAGAGYSIYALSQQAGKLEHIDAKASALEDSLARVIENIDEGMAEGEQAEGEHSAAASAVEERLAGLEKQIAGLDTSTRTGKSSNEALSEGAREMVRKIIREEQAEMLQEQNEKKVAKREEMQEKFKEMTAKHEEQQKKRLEEWIKKYSEKAGLTIAQENGILDAYKWAKEERMKRMQEKMKEGGPLMVTPGDFEELFEQRDEKIKELLTQAQYKELVDYRDKNPFPEMMMFGAIGDHGEAMEAEVIMTAPAPVKKKDKDDEDK